MLQPLFNSNCELIGWIEPGHHIFDTNMNWIAFIANNHAWSSNSGNWIGPVIGTTCLDTSGNVFAWNEGSKVHGTGQPYRPARAARPARPARPATPARPARPARPAQPIGGWSSLTLDQWLAQ